MITLALDVGGSSIKMGLVSNGSILSSLSVKTNPEKGFSAHHQGIVDGAKNLMAKAPVDKVDCVAVAFPGIVNSVSHKVLSAPAKKYEDAPGFEFSQWSQETFGCACVVDNDAHMALYGEWETGAAKNCQNFAMITLGTGIGTSVVSQGVPYRGVHFQGGNLGGHFVMNPQGEPCICGSQGCVETEASGWALNRIANQYQLSLTDELSFESVFRLARNGDSAAIQVRDHCIGGWAVAASNLVTSFDLDTVVFGGGIMKSAADIIPGIQKVLKEKIWTPWGQVKVLAAQLGNDAALIGCEVAAKRVRL